MDTTRKLLDEIEAAQFLSLTPRQVLRLANRGELPQIVFPNREIRFDPADLSQFVEAHKRPVAEGGEQ
ncbi:MAG: helix-turn-helix domain-containing protein [Thermoguttaceae bacterium]